MPKVDLFFHLVFGWFECGSFTEIGNTIHRKLIKWEREREKKRTLPKAINLFRACPIFSEHCVARKNMENLFTIFGRKKWIIRLVNCPPLTISIPLEFRRGQEWSKKFIQNRWAFRYFNIFFILSIYKSRMLWHGFLNLFEKGNKSTWDKMIYKYVILSSIQMLILLKVLMMEFTKSLCNTWPFI